MSPYHKIVWYLAGIRWLFMNLWLTRNLSRCSPLFGEDYQIVGLPRGSLRELRELHTELRGEDVSWIRRVALILAGEKLCIVRFGLNHGHICGFELFYFEPERTSRRTIHEAFIGVRPSCRRLKVATSLRQASRSHWSLNGLEGVSSDIDPSNVASMRSAISVGFRQVHENALNARSESIRLHMELR
jgi:hypothetical protein